MCVVFKVAKAFQLTNTYFRMKRRNDTELQQRMFVEPRTKSSCSDVILALEVIAASRSHSLCGQENLKSYLPSKIENLPFTGLTDGTSFKPCQQLHLHPLQQFFFLHLTSVHAPIQLYSITYFFNNYLFNYLYVYFSCLEWNRSSLLRLPQQYFQPHSTPVSLVLWREEMTSNFISLIMKMERNQVRQSRDKITIHNSLF